MQALMKTGAAETRFALSAESVEDARELCTRMGADLLEDEVLEGGDLGHAGHAPLAEETYNAGLWESSVLEGAAA